MKITEIKFLILTTLINYASPSFSQLPKIKKIECPKNYVFVGSERYDFCISKYEMRIKNNKAVSTKEGLPKTYVTREESKNLCQNAGEKFFLINEYEWSTVEKKINSYYKDFSKIPLGHSDKEPHFRLGGESSYCPYGNKFRSCEDPIRSRKVYYSSENFIYDFFGNVEEWIDYSEVRILSEKEEGSEVIKLNQKSKKKVLVDYFAGKKNSSPKLGGSYANNALSIHGKTGYFDLMCSKDHRHFDQGFRCVYVEDKELRPTYKNLKTILIGTDKKKVGLRHVKDRDGEQKIFQFIGEKKKLVERSVFLEDEYSGFSEIFSPYFKDTTLARCEYKKGKLIKNCSERYHFINKKGEIEISDIPIIHSNKYELNN